MTLTSFTRLAIVVLAVLIIGLVATREHTEVTATSLKQFYSTSLSSSANNANADTTTYTAFAGPDAIFAANINFIPPSWGIGTLVSEGGDIVIDDLIGKLRSRSLLGFFLGGGGGGCNAQTNVDFDIRAASVDPSAATATAFNIEGIVDKAAIGAANPDGSGNDDQFQSLQDDDGDYNNDGDVTDTGPPYFEAGGTYPNANGIADGVERWPSYLIKTFDFDGDGVADDNELPLFRAIGITDVSTTTVALNFLLMDIGQLQNSPTAPASQLVSALGFPNVTVLQDAGAPPQPSPITDFCTSVLTRAVTCGTVDANNNMADGCDASAKVVRTNPPVNTGVAASPPTNTHIFYTFNVGQRDADNDGIDNTLDTCVFEPDNDGDGIVEDLSDRDRDGISDGPDPTPYNPRNALLGGESEPILANDLIPDGCDPAPTQNIGTGDHDFDTFSNPLDNCPTTPNLNQSSGSISAGSNVLLGAIKGSGDIQVGGQTSDFGPGGDAIGAACDDSDGDGVEGGGTCTDGLDNDADSFTDGNDLDCSAVEGTGAASADGSCDDNLDNDGDGDYDTDDTDCQKSTGVDLVDTDDDNDGIPDLTDDTAAIPDGHYHKELLVTPVCVGGTDTDLDGWCDATETALGSSTSVNPAETGTDCANTADDDGDGYVNDGCPPVGFFPEASAQCTNALNDDVPAIDGEESAFAANDQRTNDGCPAVGGGGAESACGTDSADNDLDGFVNDGCPGGGGVGDGVDETGDRCFNNSDDDADTIINEGCPIAYPIPGEGVPESSIIDFGLDPVVVTCTDGIDNDGDTNVDDADSAGCPEDTDSSSAGCKAPSGTFGCGDPQGLFLRDEVEWFLGTSHVDRCPADATVDNEITDSHAIDFDDDGDTDGSDVSLFADRFGQELGKPADIGKKVYTVRFDIFPDFLSPVGSGSHGKIDGSDVSILAQYFGVVSCP